MLTAKGLEKILSGRRFLLSQRSSIGRLSRTGWLISEIVVGARRGCLPGLLVAEVICVVDRRCLSGLLTAKGLEKILWGRRFLLSRRSSIGRLSRTGWLISEIVGGARRGCLPGLLVAVVSCVV